MYFQNLEIIQNLDGEFNEKIIKDLDYWLATRREAVKDYLNPYNFSDYADVSIDVVLPLFFICTSKKVEILKERYDILIKQENKFIASYYNHENIPDEIIHPETNEAYKLNKEEDIRLYFELISEPESKPVFIKKSSGKDQGVGLTMALEAKQKASFAMSDLI